MEIWKVIDGYEGFYEVSSLGRVKSMPREKGFRKTAVILNPVVLSNGYAKVTLSRGIHNKKLVSVHVLVAKAFIPNPEGLPQVNHKDTSKTNNCMENLEWVTQSGNMGHLPSKKQRGLSLSKKVQQIDIRTLQVLRTWDSVKEAAESLGLNNSSIGRSVKSGGPHKGFLWRYLDKPAGMKGARPILQLPEGKVWLTQRSLREEGYDLYLIRECARGNRASYRGSSWVWATEESILKERIGSQNGTQCVDCLRCSGVGGSVQVKPHGALAKRHPSMKNN